MTRIEELKKAAQEKREKLRHLPGVLKALDAIKSYRWKAADYIVAGQREQAEGVLLNALGSGAGLLMKFAQYEERQHINEAWLLDSVIQTEELQEIAGDVDWSVFERPGGPLRFEPCEITEDGEVIPLKLP